MDAWVTSAVGDEAVDKAIVLAGSLRRVHTAKKLAVLTTLAVATTLREKLKLAFDLVVTLERSSPNCWNLEDYAKVEGFSLLVFNKCVYLSPNTLVLKNCDEMFYKYRNFAALGNDDGLDSSVYLFTPSLNHRQALWDMVKCEDFKDWGFAKCFNFWVQGKFLNWNKLDEQYNVRLSIDSVVGKRLGSSSTIVKFADYHPLDLGDFEKLQEFGTVEKFVAQLCRNIFNEDVQPSTDLPYSDLTFQSKTYKTEPIAIVGMSFRLPGGNNVDEFWNLLDNGKDAIRVLPQSRWSHKHTCLSLGDEERRVEGGFLSVPVDEFDAKFFGISGKEADLLDPQQRFLHEITWEALEDAMIDPLTLRGTQTGVFVGSWLDDYRDMVRRQIDVDSFRVYMGTSIATGAARLSHFLEVTGPSIATESACSSAVVAVDMACKSLRNHDCNLALACGVNLILKPFDEGSFSFVVAPDNRCKTFDEGANGFGRAEGCAVLILKRLSDAVRDGDNMWGLIRGSAVTQEGLSKSLGTPTVHCESLAMELALEDADVDPLAVSYVEAHGTGTQVGDPMEIAAIAKAYSRGRLEPLVIGSVKTNVGHTESVSGITGIIKVILSMKHEKIPKHLNLKRLNPAINLDVIPAKIPLESIPWRELPDKPRIAGVSSFGISGCDGHVIVQEPPAVSLPQVHDHDERPLHILKVSAKSQESFQDLLKTYENMFSSKENEEGFADLAYSANTGRATFNHRAVIIAKDFKEANSILRNGSFKSADVQSTASPLCFLFTGQGSQYPNMAATLFNSSPIFRDEFNKCDELLSKQQGINLKQVLWGTSVDMTELNRTIFSQTSIFCIEYCLLQLWESWGVKPDYVMGHSLGEFAAAVAAGALDFEDALMLVAERSRLIDNLPRGKMLVIQAEKEAVDKIIAQFQQLSPDFWVDYAALNSSTQTVVAGDSTLIEEFSKYCEGKSLKTTVLAATHAFHSRHMEPMLEAYHKVAQTVKPFKMFQGAPPKYISGMDGKLIDLKSINADYWVRHTREPVSFMDACKVAQAEGCSLFLELGPHPVLSALTMMNMGGQSLTCLPSIRRKQDCWVTMLDSLAKLYLSEWKGKIDWKGCDRYYKRSRVSIPFYPFNRKPVWESLEAELPAVHPLLGRVIPTDCDHSIFESRLTLKNTSFLQDHVIGNTVVFPGAAFLEMCLAGGHSTAQGSSESGNLKKPQRPVVLQSLRIVAPLAFYDSIICRLQTTSKLEIEDKDEIRYSVRVARHVNSSAGAEWITHATAKFLPVPAPLTKEQYAPVEIDIPSIQNSWERADINGFYEKLPQVGLHFGPKFQSLQTGWKSEKGMLFTVKVPEEHRDNHLIHPTLADAMIQAIMFWTSKDRLKIRLQVPVQIGEFRWLQTSSCPSRFIYCSTNRDGKTDCILLDEEETRLATMSGVDFIETSVKLVEGMIHQQEMAMPKLWSEVWKSTPGPWQTGYDLRTICDLPLLQLNNQQLRFIADANDIGDQEKHFNINLCNLTQLYFLNTFFNLGWNPKQGIPFTLEDLMKFLPNPKEHFNKYVRFFLRSLADTGMLVVVVDYEQNDKYIFVGTPPSHAQINKGLQEVMGPEDSSKVEYQMLIEIGRNLPEILLGKMDPVQIIFTDKPDKPNANKCYKVWAEQTSPVVKKLNDEIIIPMFDECYDVYMQNNKNGPSPILRILEVGAGIGAFTEDILNSMEIWGKPIEYYFTDVSTSSFKDAEKRFENFSRRLIFKKFDIEEDALVQGFCPKYFDMIVAHEVLHMTKDISKTLRNLKCLLKPGGIFQISETTQPDLGNKLIFGLLEGYWQFEDEDFRPDHATLTAEKWEQALTEINCDKVICTPMYNNKRSFITARLSDKGLTNVLPVNPTEKFQYSWLIFYHESSATAAELLKEKLIGVNRKVHTVKRPSTCTENEMKDLMRSKFRLALEEVERLEGVIYLWGLSDDTTSRDQSQISLPVLNLLQEMAQCVTIPRFYVVTQGTAYVDGSKVTNPTAGTLHGIIKSISNENVSLHLTCLDLCPDEPVGSQVGSIFDDLWCTNESNRIIAYRNGNRLFCKLVSAKLSNNEPLHLPSGSARFQLQLPKTRVISDLEFGVLENYTLEENEVEVKISAIGLNFRDVFAVLKPTHQFEDLNSVGIDFAGVITKLGPNVANWKVGDRVTGMNQQKNLSLPSHIKIEETLLISIPPSVTFTEGATLPTVFLTAYHCLIKLAKMKRGDIVLIHTASGGVGLCAIQLAKRVGAEVIATAGSQRKQDYLRSMGIKHVFHSRSTQFGKQISEVTNGRGVDIVLNSITGDGFKEASLSALAPNGWFIEMSKLNVWRPDEVKEMRPDVFYEIVDLMTMARPELRELLRTLKTLLYDGSIHPISYERFDAVNIRGALNYMQKAKHIGKIVCVLPEVNIENSKIVSMTPLCNEFSTYLVTGGLGGIGFELVKWMLNNGAKHIAIASRSHPKPEIASQLAAWNKCGKHVEAFSIDIGSYLQCEQLFQALQSPSRGFPKLRGVMHVAGVLADATLENQTWNKYHLAYNPKVDGTWNLHDLTKNLLLEHFVVFSSVASTVGAPGQSNYAAGNNFEDSLVAYRRYNGLPATTINWGNWGETGMATELDFPGIRPISTSQGMQTLETVLKTQMSHLTVFNVQSFSQAVKLFPRLKSYVEDHSIFGDEKVSVIINSDEFWKTVDNAEDRQGKLLAFKTLVKSTLKNILKIDQNEEFSELMDFQALGIDSLMSLELMNGLQNILGSRISLSVSQLKDCTNTEEMANQLLSSLQGKGALYSGELLNQEELCKLIREDSILPENVRPSEGMTLKNVSEVENVLLTGATGTLGPYILRELSHRPSIKKIFCLVRKTMQASPMERLLKRLQFVHLVDEVDLSKVECIQGDVTEDKFGLSEEEYNDLANNVDAIFNSAVRIDYIANYNKAPEKKKLDMRAVNVKGAIRILEFAVHRKLKHVYHASTILSLRTANDEGYALEDWQDVGAFDQCSYNWGYPVSKHISEELCRQGVERGVPCKVFRFPLIGGDSKTGRCEIATNHFVLRWLTYLKLNRMPDVPLPMVFMPVDHCAQISVDIFFNSQASLGVYNVAQKETGTDQSIITVAEEFGIQIELVSFAEFVAQSKLTEDSPLSPFHTIYDDVEGLAVDVHDEYENPRLNFFKKYFENKTTFFGSRKLSQLIQNYEALESTESVMRRDMNFLKESGIFDKYRIQYA